MDNKNLESFVKKMYEIQFSEQEKVLSNNELKEIALDTGLSENDWQQTQQLLRASEQNGQQHLNAKNWNSAIKEYETATSFNPFKVYNVYNLAVAYKNRGEQNNNKSDINKAEQYANQCLTIQPGYSPAIQLIANINEDTTKEIKKSSKNKKYIIIGIVAGLIFFGMIVGGKYVSINNTVVEKDNLVKGKWAQVENVYQRRADLIPQLVQTVKAASEFEQETLEMLVEARANATSVSIDPGELSADQIADFQAKQEELSQAIARFIMISEDYPELKSLDNFRDLQAQIEGSENRISVERRRFNQAVQDYNTYVKKFPQKLLGHDEKGYFKANKDAMKVPDGI